MKKILLFIFVSLIFIQTNSQSVNIDSVRINNTIPRIIKLTDLRKTGISIDSITNIPRIMDASTADSLVYIGNSYFQFFIKDNVCMMESIVFDDKIKNLILSGQLVDKATSFEDLKRMFPLDCNTTKPISIFGKKELFQHCSIPVRDDQGRLLDMRIVFFLQNNRLVRIDFWEPV